MPNAAFPDSWSETTLRPWLGELLNIGMSFWTGMSWEKVVTFFFFSEYDEFSHVEWLWQVWWNYLLFYWGVVIYNVHSFRCTTKWFGICIYCEVITPIYLVNNLWPHIVEDFLLLLRWVLKIYSLVAAFKCGTRLLTVVTKAIEFFNWNVRSWIPSPIFFTHLFPTTNLFSVSVWVFFFLFFFFLKISYKWNHMYWNTTISLSINIHSCHCKWQDFLMTE